MAKFIFVPAVRNLRNYIEILKIIMLLLGIGSVHICLYVIKACINKFIFEKVLSKIKRIVKIFSIFDKLFSKLIYYCVSKEHTIVKSLCMDLVNVCPISSC